MRRLVVLSVLGVFIAGLLFTAPANAVDPNPVVLEAQKCLYKLRYFNARLDGFYGPITQRAVLQFQYEMGLPVTGVLDKTTFEHLKRPAMILNTQNFAPFHFGGRRKGEAEGPVSNIVKATCQEAGINCRVFLHDNWKTAQEEVKGGHADGMFVIAWNSARAKWLHRSTAIIETEYGVFVKDNDELNFEEALEEPSVLSDYTFGVYGPSGTASSLEKLNVVMVNKGVNMQVYMQPDDKPLFRKLSMSKGKFAVYSNRMVGESLIKGLGLANVRYAGQHRKLSYYVGFSKDKAPKDLVRKFDAAYLRLVERGEVIAIMANHSLSMPKHVKVASKPEPIESDAVSADRFSIHGPDGMRVVVDAKTCLMWQRSGTHKHCNWQEAAEYVEKMNRVEYSGFSDWRLPTIQELSSLMEKQRYTDNKMYIHPVFDAVQQSCWSADRKSLDVQFADYYDGAIGSKNQGDTNYVRAVRGAVCINQ